MKPETRRLAGILFILLPTVMYGGVTLLMMLMNDPSYMANPLRQNLWRAGHAHAGVLLVLSLVALRYVDEGQRCLARGSGSHAASFRSPQSSCLSVSFCLLQIRTQRVQMSSSIQPILVLRYSPQACWSWV